GAFHDANTLSESLEKTQKVCNEYQKGINSLIDLQKDLKKSDKNLKTALEAKKQPGAPGNLAQEIRNKQDEFKVQLNTLRQNSLDKYITILSDHVDKSKKIKDFLEVATREMRSEAPTLDLRATDMALAGGITKQKKDKRQGVEPDEWDEDSANVQTYVS